MIVVIEQENSFVVIIPALLVRIVLAMHDQSTVQSIGVLHQTVAVVPVRTPLTDDLEPIRQLSTRRNGTLGESSNAVHERSAVLVHAVPVDRGSLIDKVLDLDNESVTLIDFEEGSRRLTVDENALLEESIGCRRAIGDGPVKLANPRSEVSLLALANAVRVVTVTTATAVTAVMMASIVIVIMLMFVLVLVLVLVLMFMLMFMFMFMFMLMFVVMLMLVATMLMLTIVFVLVFIMAMARPVTGNRTETIRLWILTGSLDILAEVSVQLIDAAAQNIWSIEVGVAIGVAYIAYVVCVGASRTDRSWNGHHGPSRHSGQGERDPREPHSGKL